MAVATGAETEFGEIHRLVGQPQTLATPLTKKLAWFGKVLTVGILGLAAVTFGVGVLRGRMRSRRSPPRSRSRSARSPRDYPPRSPSRWPSA